MALPRVLYSAAANFKRAWPLMRDERVPTGLKAVTGILALFIISPLDIFGDIPVLGLLDDAVLLTLLCISALDPVAKIPETKVYAVRVEKVGAAATS